MTAAIHDDDPVVAFEDRPAGYRQYGVTGEIAATIAEEAFDFLDAPVIRCGGANVPIPFTRSLEPLAAPDRGRLAQSIIRLVHEN